MTLPLINERTISNVAIHIVLNLKKDNKDCATQYPLPQHLRRVNGMFYFGSITLQISHVHRRVPVRHLASDSSLHTLKKLGGLPM